MYQQYISEMVKARHSEYPTKEHHRIRQLFAGDLAYLFKMALDDASNDPCVEIAKGLITADFQLYTPQLTQLGPQEAARLYAEHEASIKGHCRPNFVDPGWLVDLNALGIDKLVLHLAEYCYLSANYDGGTFEDLADLPIGPRRKLARLGMEAIHQGYTFEFLNFAASVALETGVTGSQFKRFMAVGMGKTHDHFARALIKAIAAQYSMLPASQIRYAVDSVWKFTRSDSAPKGFDSAFKAELTAFFRKLDVPVSVFARSAKDKDDLLGQDLGL